MTFQTFVLRACTLLLLVLCASAPAQAQSHHHSHAHVHGQIQLGIAIDGDTVVVDIDTPLDSLLGFEHPPRTAHQKKSAAAWRQRLSEAKDILRFNPEGGCKLQHANLTAPILGLGQSASVQPQKDHGEHSDLEGSWTFNCPTPQALRALELGFFKWSAHAQQVEVRWVRGNKQGKLTLKRPQTAMRLPD